MIARSMALPAAAACAALAAAPAARAWDTAPWDATPFDQVNQVTAAARAKIARVEAEENVRRAIGDRQVRKRVHVPGRVVNFVV